MSTIPCWIISLNPDGDGPQTLSRELAAQDINHSFFPAVDGRQGTPPLQGRECIDERLALLRHGKILSNSQIGCYLAHYRALQKAWDDGLERVCIMEDDIGLEDHFGAALKAIATLPDDVEMLRLMALRIRRRKVLGSLDSGMHTLVRPERGWCGTQGYVVNRRGMKKILDAGCRIFEPIDKFYDHFWEYDLRQFGIEPHVIYEIEHPSSIQKRPAQKLRIPLLLRLLAPFHKAAFSRSRHRYLKGHADEFYPAEVPTKRMGRTKRMK